MPMSPDLRLEDLFADLGSLLALRAGRPVGWGVRCGDVNGCVDCDPPTRVVVEDEHGVELGKAPTLRDALIASITELRASARRMAHAL